MTKARSKVDRRAIQALREEFVRVRMHAKWLAEIGRSLVGPCSHSYDTFEDTFYVPTAQGCTQVERVLRAIELGELE